jgi:hypothetical protein
MPPLADTPRPVIIFAIADDDFHFQTPITPLARATAFASRHTPRHFHYAIIDAFDAADDITPADDTIDAIFS